MTEYRCPSDIELEQRLERIEKKRIYDRKYYRENKGYRIAKLIRTRALIELSKKFPIEFQRILKKLKKEKK